jgi:tetratricopeptide (TPR) repeat protein
MLPLDSPLQAYIRDLARNPTRSDFGSVDTIWLLVAQSVQRVTRAPDLERDAVAANTGNALRGMLAANTAIANGDTEAEDLDKLCSALERMHDADAADAACRSIRAMARRMIDANALCLAFTLVGYLRGALTAARPAEIALAFAEQGLVARLLGELDDAEELYHCAEEVAAKGGSAEARVRALLGRGVIARVRGNYPQARALFHEGLHGAAEAGLADLAGFAHGGLTITAMTAGDYNAALAHGWAAYECAAGDAGEQFVALVNLAEVSLRAGYPSASLHAFMAALQQTDVPHYQLAAAAGAALAAANSGAPDVVRPLASFIEGLVDRSALPYESASALHSLSKAFAALGDVDRAEALRERVYRMATAGKFAELMLATEPRPRPEPAAVTPRTLDAASSRVIDSLERLDPRRSYQLLASYS